MKKFENAELEVITFEDDMVVASGDCPNYICMGDTCQCNGQQVCIQEN